VFAEAGKRTDLAVRFSTVIGGRDSSEAARDGGNAPGELHVSNFFA
jgi:catalase